MELRPRFFAPVLFGLESSAIFLVRGLYGDLFAGIFEPGGILLCNIGSCSSIEMNAM
jgi:hypothetical protein